MKRLDQKGQINGLAFPMFMMTVLFVFATVFALWAFSTRQDYKSNTDKKIAAAVVVAKQQESTKKDSEFVDKEKQPLKAYRGPETYGSLSFQYPKTWSGLITEATQGATPVDAYFYPDYLPGLPNSSSAVVYALRVQIISTAYDEVVRNFTAQVAIGTVKVVPFKLEKVPNALGVRIDGVIAAGKTGAMIAMPLRDKTIEVWTEAPQYLSDFNNSVLPSISYVP